MQEIITAIGKDKINEQLKKEKFPILKQDIENQKELLKIIKNNKKIKILIISENIPGNLDIKQLLNIIVKENKLLNIIIILEKRNLELEKYLKNKNIKNILYSDKSTILEIKNIINKYNKINVKATYQPANRTSSKINKKIITIIGASNKNKNIFSYLFSIYLKKENKKILLIDLDILNNNINNFFNINPTKKVPNKLILKTYYNIDVFNTIYFLYKRKIKITQNDFKIIIEKLNYDFIIINTPSEYFFNITEKLINISNISIMFAEPNLLELKKANKLIKIYTKNWNINKEKINIIFNEYSNKSIYLEIVKKIFNNYKMLETVKINDCSDKLKNKKNYEKIIREIKKEVKWN